MFAAPKATALPQIISRITPRTETSFCSALIRHKPCLLIASSPPRAKDLARTTRKVGAIEIVAIAVLVTLDFRALSRLLRSIRPRSRLKTIVIVAATGQRVGKIGTWARPPITTVTRRAILPTNALSLVSQKTSIGLGNLLVGDWY